MYNSYRSGETGGYGGSTRQAGGLDEEAVLGILKHLNAEELQRLLEDDAKLDELINESNPVKNIGSEREMLLTSNKSIAEYNIAKEPVLADARQRLATSHETAKTLLTEAQDKVNRLGSNSASSMSLDTILALLQSGAATIEEDTEKLAERFLENKLDLDAFMEVYIEQRTVAHLRKIKSEKMAELVNRGVSSRSAPPPPVSRGPPQAQNWSGQHGAIPPYPMGGMHMPNPAHYNTR